MKQDGMQIDEWGDKRWYKNNLRHREDGPAYESADGSKWWWVNGKCHREDGPAMECADGDKAWYVNNKLHRLDGPAIEYHDGDKRWFVNGKEYSSFDDWLEAVDVSEQEKVFFKLMYG
jgi:hypothetical protein